MNDFSDAGRIRRNLANLSDSEHDDIVEKMLSAVQQFLVEFDIDASRLDDPLVVQKLRTALFDCLMFYAQIQFFDPFDDMDKMTSDAKETATLLSKIGGLFAKLPESSRSWYARNVEEGENPLDDAFQVSLQKAQAFFDRRSRRPRGKKANLDINLAVEPAIKAVEIALGRDIRRVLLMAPDTKSGSDGTQNETQGFVDLDAKLVAQILSALDPEITPKRVKTALQSYFSNNKLR